MHRRLFFMYTIASSTMMSSKSANSQAKYAFDVEIRLDQKALTSLTPLERKRFSGKIDRSAEAVELASRAPPSRAAPILLIIAGTIAFNQAIKLIMKLRREIYYGGVIVDCRKSPAFITNSLKIPAGTTIVIDKDGKSHTFVDKDITTEELSSLAKE